MIDNSYYVLGALIMNETNYKASLDGYNVEFNICDPIIPSGGGDPCAGAFGCIEGPNILRTPLSGTNFKENVDAVIEADRTNDSQKG